MVIDFIKDPIHGNIIFEEDEKWALEIINTKEFKRLETISQLGECFMVFPSAKHTRFSHSLGVFYLAKQYINSLNITNKKDRNIVLAAALLHDIGHGPRSHSFELYTGYKHESMSIKIISNKEGNIYKILNKYNINVQDVIKIINKKHEKKWMIQIVSSQIDADRLDYLLRDSYHSGVTYGKSVDYIYLFERIKIVNDEIVYDKKVIHLIETILFARQQMFKQLYTNTNILCYETIMIKVFKRWKELFEKGFKFIDKFNLYNLFNSFLNDEEWDIDSFLKLDENTYNMILKSLYEENDKILHNLLDNYFHKNNFKLVESNNKEFDYRLYNKDFYSKKEPIYTILNQKIVEIIEVSDIIKSLSKNVKSINYVLVKNNII